MQHQHIEIVSSGICSTSPARVFVNGIEIENVREIEIVQTNKGRMVSLMIEPTRIDWRQA